MDNTFGSSFVPYFTILDWSKKYSACSQLDHLKNLDAHLVTGNPHKDGTINASFILTPSPAHPLTLQVFVLCRRRARVWISGGDGKRPDDRRAGRRRRFDFLVVGRRGRGGGRGISAEEDEGQARSKYRGTDGWYMHDLDSIVTKLCTT